MNKAMVTMQQARQEHIAAPSENGRDQRQLEVAYIMSRFPKLTETFILYEMLAVERSGLQVEVYPLLRARTTAIHPNGASLWKKLVERISRPRDVQVIHPEAVPLVDRAHFQPFFSWHILLAQAHFLLRKPLTYLSTLWSLLRATWGSPRFFLGGLALFPKTAYFAYLMVAEGVSHVHAHFASHPAAAAFVIHRLADVPYSFTAHGSDLHVDRHMLREKVEEAAFVVTVSDYNKELIIRECGEEFRDKIVVIHCGVDTHVFRPNGSNVGHKEPGVPFTILCIGTLYEVKGQTYLIDACRRLRDQGVDFACYFVGDGPYRASLTKQVDEAGLSERVQFLGRRTREEITELLQEADVVAAPSVPTQDGRREGIPVVLMEAMASGVPVVASGISGIPELVEDGRSGLLVPPRDPQALADALERLRGDPALRQRLGRAGREKVVRDFDLLTNAATLAQHFIEEARL